MSTDQAERLNVVVVRRIRAGREADYAAAIREFARWAVDQPGHEGIQILRPAAGGRDYTTVSRFRDESARQAFTDSDGYRGWMARLGAITEGDPRIEETSGLEGWFPPPAAGGGARLPMWKMAVATFLGVFPTSILLDHVIGPGIKDWQYVVRQATFAAAMVALLNWIVMPLITRVLRRWLRPRPDAAERRGR
jgi:antibiotic biosynthesis monooxygenase (ABM) superfamily enzyme